MRAPERIETPRLLLRKPALSDAEAVFTRYAGDAEVAKFMGWPRHRTIAETRFFLVFSDAEWERWPAGPYLIESRETGQLLGSTGLSFESPAIAETGYILARDARGFGYATEALQAMVSLARELSLQRLYARCHPDNQASIRVLEKCGFTRDAATISGARFPNLDSGQTGEALSYSIF